MTDAELIQFLVQERDKALAYRDFWKNENESRAILISKICEMIGYDNSDGFHSSPDPLEMLQAIIDKKV